MKCGVFSAVIAAVVASAAASQDLPINNLRAVNNRVARHIVIVPDGGTVIMGFGGGRPYPTERAKK